MKWLIVLWIYIKRRFKSPAFIISALLVFLLLPLSSVFTERTESYSAGFYTEDINLADKIEGERGGVNLVYYDDQNLLSRDVENRSLICGYILPEDIASAVSENSARSVIRLVSPGSALTELADEALFAAVAQACTDEIMELYLDEKSVSYDRDKLEERYRELVSSDNFSYIRYEYMDAATGTQKQEQTTDPLPSFIGIYIMLGAVLSINVWIGDRSKGIPWGAMNIAAGVLILVIFSALPVFAAGKLDAVMIARLILYGILLTGYCTLIGQLCNSTAFVCGLLPVLILGSLGVCPIAGDLTQLIPSLKYVALIFAPYYFTAEFSFLGAGTVIFAALSILIYFLRSNLFAY